MPASLNAIFEAIGHLRATVEGLRTDIKKAEQKAADDNEAANVSRAAVHKRVDQLAREMGEVRSEVRAMRRDVDETKQITDDIKRWRLMGLGALGMAGLAGAALAGGAVHLWQVGVAELSRLFR